MMGESASPRMPLSLQEPVAALENREAFLSNHFTDQQMQITHKTAINSRWSHSCGTAGETLQHPIDDFISHIHAVSAIHPSILHCSLMMRFN